MHSSLIKKSICAILILLVTVSSAIFFPGCERQSASETVTGYGLHVDENGIVFLNGKKFYGMGMNWHGGFSMAYGGDKTHLDQYFESLRDGGIPFVRVMMGIFYTKELNPMYYDNMEYFFKAMDLFVQKAEEYHVGIIASLNWSYSIFTAYAGENRDQVDNPYSLGNALLKQYVTAVVTRYKDSPALWGWEIGNEGNLDCDLAQSKDHVDYMASDLQFTSDMMGMYYAIVSDTIRAIDPYRMITNGDGGYRGAWKSLKMSAGKAWSPKDTDEDYRELYALMSQGSIDTLSVHYLDKSLMKEFNRRARDMGLAYFLGEFHSTAGFCKGYDDPNYEACNQSWQEIKDAILDADIQIAANWCYGRDIQQFQDGTSVELGWITNEKGEPHYQNLFAWDGAVELNKYYKDNGMTDADSYWENAEYLFYVEEG